MYTIIDKNTRKELRVQLTDYCIENEFATLKQRTEYFVVPYFNFETETFYEGATVDEISEANKILVPQSVTRRQLLLALAYFGIDSMQIDTLISLLDEPEKTFALISWKEAATFDRDNEMLNQMANAMEISQEQLDQIFINASNL